MKLVFIYLTLLFFVINRPNEVLSESSLNSNLNDQVSNNQEFDYDAALKNHEHYMAPFRKFREKSIALKVLKSSSSNEDNFNDLFLDMFNNYKNKKTSNMKPQSDLKLAENGALRPLNLRTIKTKDNPTYNGDAKSTENLKSSDSETLRPLNLRTIKLKENANLPQLSSPSKSSSATSKKLSAKLTPNSQQATKSQLKPSETSFSTLKPFSPNPTLNQQIYNQFTMPSNFQSLKTLSAKPSINPEVLSQLQAQQLYNQQMAQMAKSLEYQQTQMSRSNPVYYQSDEYNQKRNNNALKVKRLKLLDDQDFSRDHARLREFIYSKNRAQIMQDKLNKMMEKSDARLNTETTNIEDRTNKFQKPTNEKQKRKYGKQNQLGNQAPIKKNNFMFEQNQDDESDYEDADFDKTLKNTNQIKSKLPLIKDQNSIDPNSNQQTIKQTPIVKQPINQQPINSEAQKQVLTNNSRSTERKENGAESSKLLTSTVTTTLSTTQPLVSSTVSEQNSPVLFMQSDKTRNNIQESNLNQPEKQEPINLKEKKEVSLKLSAKKKNEPNLKDDDCDDANLSEEDDSNDSDKNKVEIGHRKSYQKFKFDKIMDDDDNANYEYSIENFDDMIDTEM